MRHQKEIWWITTLKIWIKKNKTITTREAARENEHNEIDKANKLEESFAVQRAKELYNNINDKKTSKEDRRKFTGELIMHREDPDYLAHKEAQHKASEYKNTADNTDIKLQKIDKL